FERTRNVVFPTVAEQIRSDSDGNQLSGAVELARRMASTTWPQQIFGRVQYQRAKIDGYNETGTYAWNVDGQSERSTSAALGYEIAHPVQLDAFALRPFASVTLAHEFEDADHALVARLPGD